MNYECLFCDAEISIADDEHPIEKPSCVNCDAVMVETGSVPLEDVEIKLA